MKTPLILFLLFLSLPGKSQSVSLATGLGLDANNPGKTMAFIPVEARWQPIADILLSLTINYDRGLGMTKNAEAFTLNPDLPGKVILKEKSNTNIVTIGANIDIKLFNTSSTDELLLTVMPLAYSFHDTKVSFRDFDKENYTILNEDINASKSGLVSAFGLRYLFRKDKFIALNIQTPLLRNKPTGADFKYAAPVRLMFGYRYNYKKSK